MERPSALTSANVPSCAASAHDDPKNGCDKSTTIQYLGERVGYYGFYRPVVVNGKCNIWQL